jgi:hypothetical protein
MVCPYTGSLPDVWTSPTLLLENTYHDRHPVTLRLRELTLRPPATAVVNS